MTSITPATRRQLIKELAQRVMLEGKEAIEELFPRVTEPQVLECFVVQGIDLLSGILNKRGGPARVLKDLENDDYFQKDIEAFVDFVAEQVSILGPYTEEDSIEWSYVQEAISEKLIQELNGHLDLQN